MQEDHRLARTAGVPVIQLGAGHVGQAVLDGDLFGLSRPACLRRQDAHGQRAARLLRGAGRQGARGLSHGAQRHQAAAAYRRGAVVIGHLLFPF
jgi:hypothetical protein